MGSFANFHIEIVHACFLVSLLHVAAALPTCRHHRTLLGWDRSVGPIYCLRAFWIRMVVVSDPALVHQLLRSERSTGVRAAPPHRRRARRVLLLPMDQAPPARAAQRRWTSRC
jgi:cytochrome P450